MGAGPQRVCELSLLHLVKPSFVSGRVSPRIFGRIDLDQYVTGLEECRNFVVFPHGGVTFRSGTQFINEVKDSANAVRLIPFVFSNRQANMLEFGPNYIRFYQDRALIVDGGGVPVEVATPYSGEDVDRLRFDQSGDIIFLASASHPPKELRRLAVDDWDLVDFDFQRPIASNAELRAGPYLEENNTATTLTLSGTGVNVTITASSVVGINDDQGFLATDTGTGTERRLIRINKGGDWFDYIITAVNSTTSVDATRISGVAPPDATATSAWRLGAWSNTTGWPEVVKFHQQRLLFAQIQTLWGSATADFDNFAPTARDGAVTDDNAFTFSLASGRIDIIRWLQSSRVLEVGTEGAEFAFTGGTAGADSAITPANVLSRKGSEMGSFFVGQPIFSDNGTVFINRSGRKLFNFTFNFAGDNYISTDLTLLSEDFTLPGVFEMAYQAEPDMVIWALRTDGRLLACTYNPKQEVIAWSEHVLGGNFEGDTPVVESVAVIPADVGVRDEVWVSVLRTIGGQERRYIEVMKPLFGTDTAIENGFFVDSGLSYDGAPETTFTGLDHLEGEEVTIVADGTVRPPEVVTGGEVTIDEAASVVHIGLSYQGEIVLLPIEPGNVTDALTARRARIREVGLLLFRSLLVETGVVGKPLELVALRTPEDPLGESLEPFTGLFRFPIESNSEFRNRIRVVQNRPLPATVLSVLPVIDV